MKIKQFQNELQRKKIDAALFLSNEQKPDFCLEYLSQTKIDNGALVVPARKPAFLIIPGFDCARIRKLSPLKVLGVEKSFMYTLKQKIKAKKIGINEAVLSVAEAKRIRKSIKAKLVPVCQIVNSLRVEKTQEEIALIKKSCEISCKIMNECIARLGKFKTEQEVSQFLQKKTIENNCELAFMPIAASAGHAAFPHHNPNGRLKKGFLIIDFGVRYKGYCSDITRTVYIGKPGKKERDVYSLLLKAQEWAVLNAKPSRSIESIEHDATKKLEKYGKNFIHRIGHSIGLQVHDPVPSKITKRHILREGMCWTIEPGIYVKDRFGMRIEDTILVEKSKCRVLTAKTNKGFIAIRA